MIRIMGHKSQISFVSYPERCISEAHGSLRTILAQALLIHNRPMLVNVELKLNGVLPQRLGHLLPTSRYDFASLIYRFRRILHMDRSALTVPKQSIFANSDSAHTVATLVTAFQSIHQKYCVAHICRSYALKTSAWPYGILHVESGLVVRWGARYA